MLLDLALWKYACFLLLLDLGGQGSKGGGSKAEDECYLAFSFLKKSIIK